MRGQLLFLCSAHPLAGSWRLLRECLSLLLLATVWVPHQVWVHQERYLELAPLLRVAGGLGLASLGVIAIHQKKYMPGRDRISWSGPVCATICPVRALYSPEGRHT